MPTTPTLSYRHRSITPEDIDFIRSLIAAHPDLSRWSLSKKLCESWNWVQSNGALRDMVARGLMLMLHRQGHIVLPEVRRIKRNPMIYRQPPALIEVDETLLQTSLAELGPLQLTQVRRTADEALFNSLLQQHHYLGYSRPVGEHLKYLLYACLLYTSPSPRDRTRSRMPSSA